MKRLKKNNFTLIELMFVVAVLVILIGISFVAGNNILRKSAAQQTKAELKMLHAAVKGYRARYDSYPAQAADNSFNFVEKLSKMPPGSGSGDKRVMFADFRKSNLNISTDDYDAKTPTPGAIASDPYDNPYEYHLDDKSTTSAEDDTFYILSVGIDGNNGGGDDIRSDRLNE